MPGSDWDVGVLARVQRLEEMPRGAPNRTGPAEIRAVAKAVAPAVEAEHLEDETKDQALGIPDDPVGIDAYIINMYRRCLGAWARKVPSGHRGSSSAHFLTAQLGCQR